ncbi:hypothetical protein NEHOM01_1276 [Nematocida homosporus]|uniref:uncharacterized protein n=1 Tax=Nematocida homosporus TaxID=1912981 RepID=UPI00221EF300|nr:uncharacterized protein NEHOM01_1276 [Nematocida homosporus]KAI5186094.1 hypothetical protein NEHOM01_1276 [Nematocida homosporus]
MRHKLVVFNFLVITGLVLGLVKATQVLDPERFDREYFMVKRCDVLTETPNNTPDSSETPNHNPNPIEELKVGQDEYQFRVGPKVKELNKNIELIDKVDRLLSIQGRTLEHKEGTTKLTMVPFDSITLETEDGPVKVGEYYGTFDKKGELTQTYIKGDKCDICRGKNWTGMVTYKSNQDPLHLTGPIESSTCTYKLLVLGEELAETETYHPLEVSQKQSALTPNTTNNTTPTDTPNNTNTNSTQPEFIDQDKPEDHPVVLIDIPQDTQPSTLEELVAIIVSDSPTNTNSPQSNSPQSQSNSPQPNQPTQTTQTNQSVTDL